MGNLISLRQASFYHGGKVCHCSGYTGLSGLVLFQLFLFWFSSFLMLSATGITGEQNGPCVAFDTTPESDHFGDSNEMVLDTLARLARD
jgi:hypothetical protein